MIPLLAPMPAGDGPSRAHRRQRAGLSAIARRVAMKALTEHKADVLLEVYCAGIAHATALSTPAEPKTPLSTTPREGEA